MSNNWNTFTNLVENKQKIPRHILDLVAIRSLLVKSLSGYSNLRICKSMVLPYSYVANSLSQFLSEDFFGWPTDLDFNPIALYNRCKGNFKMYMEEVSMISATSNIKLIEKSFHLCKYFYDVIDKRIKEYYEQG